MAFPSSVVSLSNPAGSDHLNSPSHATQHGNVNDEVELIEAWGYDGAGYTSFTPGTLKQGATTVTYTAGEARYRRFGTMFHVYIVLTATSAGSSGQEITLTLPSPLSFVSGLNLVGAGTILDQGVKIYPAFIYSINGTDFRWLSTETHGYVGNGPNWALASTDILIANFMACG